MEKNKDYEIYLLSISEKDVLTLSPLEAYNRRALLNAIEQPALLRSMGYSPNPQGNEKVYSKRSYGTNREYRDWYGNL